MGFKISPYLESISWHPSSRDPIPSKQICDFALVNTSQRVEPVNAWDDISGLELVKSACRQQELPIPKSPRNPQARLFHGTQS